MDEYIGVIMAGGDGSRFWPRSRHCKPKQLLSMSGGSTLIQDTFARVTQDCPPGRTMVVTIAAQCDGTREQLPLLAPENLITEPAGRNTAVAMAYAAATVRARYPGTNPVLGFFAADHDIQPADAFSRAVQTAVALARRERTIVAFGITPTFPATGYGYIRRGAAVENATLPAFRIEAFAEKPELRRAENYIADGCYLWNSGIFFAPADVLEEALCTHLPELSAAFREYDPGAADAAATLRAIYDRLPAASFDRSVMERISRAIVLETDFAWDDVGSWLALERHLRRDGLGNATRGGAVFIESRNCTVDAKRLVALVGAEDLIVVETDDAILICDRHRAEEVRAVVERLKADGRTDLV